MSDSIQTQAFDGQPFQHRWSSPRVGDAPGWDGPPDDPRENEPEVWCRSCQWDHPKSASCVFGRNQP